ncbi:MAG: hypothetical protein HY763_06000 [Planctomycetes bacterium]|nr:hypothetical protein [Planctomycetota bacterium]
MTTTTLEAPRAAPEPGSGRIAERDQRQERRAALGEMAAGVANELRNPLGGVGLYASLLEKDLTDRPPQLDIVRRIGAGVETIESIVSEILAFAGGAAPRRRRCPAAEVVDAALTQVAAKAAARDVQFDVDLRLAQIQLLCDPAQVERAIINLLLNAVEAVDRGGRIWVRAGENRRDRRQAAIVVEDNGPGIPPALRQQVFHPFFTTKDTGTGLGLAIVQRIAEAHGGSAAAGHRKGGGAAFVLLLPAAPTDECFQATGGDQ